MSSLNWLSCRISLRNPPFTELPPPFWLKSPFFHWKVLRLIPFPKISLKLRVGIWRGSPRFVPIFVPICAPSLTLQSLLFPISLLFCFPISLVFLWGFPFFSKDFRDSAKRKTLAFLGVSLASFRQSKGWRVRVVVGNTPVCSDCSEFFRFVPICFQNKSEQIRETPFCWAFLQLLKDLEPFFCVSRGGSQTDPREKLDTPPLIRPPPLATNLLETPKTPRTCPNFP